MPTPAEMMADLAAADAAGDTQLAQHIAGLIKASAQPSLGESMKVGLLQGATLGAGPRLAAASAGAPDLPIQELGGQTANEAAVDPSALRNQSPEQAYNEAQQSVNEAKTAHPWGYGLAYGAGSLPATTVAALAAPQMAAAGPGASLLARMGIGGVNGLLQGGSAGLATGLAGGDVAANAAGGAVGGGLLGSAAPAIGAGLRSVGASLRQKALEQGRKALTGNAGTISVSKELSPAAVEAAYSTGAIRPLSTIKGIAGRLAESRGSVGDQYGQIVDALAAKGVTGPDALALARQLANEANGMVQTANPAPGMFRRVANQIANEPTGPGTMGGSLPLTTAESIKRNLQSLAKSDYAKVPGAPSLVGDARMALASRLRQAVEDSIQTQQGMAPQEAAAFEPVKKRLGAIIEASNAANKAAARASRRSSVGLPEMIAASGGVASGNPMAALELLLATKAVKSMGPSTYGSLSRALGNALGQGAGPSMSPVMAGAATETMTPQMRALLEMLSGRAGVRLAPAGAEENK